MDAGQPQAANALVFKHEWGPSLHSIIVRSPPSQLSDIIDGCQKLAQVDLPLDFLTRCCAEYNERKLLPVPLTGKHEGRVGICNTFSKHAQKPFGITTYSEPDAKTVFEVDHQQQACVSVTEKEKSNDLAFELVNFDNDEAEPYRQALEEAMKRYVARYYGCHVGVGLAGTATYTSPGEEIGGDVELLVYISSRRSRVQGKWAGSWTSQWKIKFTPGDNSLGSIVGTMTFESCFFEDGNTHFQRKQTKEGRIKETEDPKKFAQEMVKVIKSLEDGFHQETDELCLGLTASGLKSLRRVLPISSERFDWRPARHHFVADLKNFTKLEG